MSRLKSCLRIAVFGGVAALTAALAPAWAQDYPSRDIHVIVGFPAGSGADVYARYFANKLSILSKQSALVENRPGAAASIATEAVARAKPDGYTLFIGGSDSFASPLYLFKKPTTDPRKDFAYISPLVSQGFILMVDAQKPFKSVADLTAYLKEKKDKASYATANNPATILAEIYKNAAGLETMQVQYRTSADFINDMIGGRIDFVMADPVFALARINDGKMRPLAVSTAKRLKPVADIPTLQEAGIPNVDMNLWWVTAAPAGTPTAIVDKLNGWFTEIGKMEETRTFLAKFGAEPFVGTPAETTAHINKEIKDWAEYVRLAKLEAQ
ncbi:tripartite tricarboxylate transporter substrate binding protein [Roseiarcaceae bacterium H3SJ34-1]|uniref:Bug family tripartite tricarboxylate transporter substrate binding protein n=1 Tax=Terripilifer ovatus TaxID=3032367 RepID=UPI003AB96020|nr:tripartite tricarboxylate transporter substrate binding protein [Roseiarcaceae bacterium H3SJ34-1]